MQRTPDRQPDTYTVTEAAARLGITKGTLYRLIRDGECPFKTIKLGGVIRIPRAELDGALAPAEAVS